MTEQLQKKVDRAVKLIQSAGKIAKEHGQPLEIAYSGGKDSDVILELAKMSGVDYRVIYKNTTIDPAGTIKHAQDMGAEILRPTQSFFALVAKNGFPSRFRRFCCRFLKEYKVLDYAVVGIRREESTKRAERYKEPEQCRVYSKKEKVRQYMPILDWTSEDVSEFIAERGITCAPVYYDENGIFHVEERLGCMCCPLQSKNVRIRSFKKYPNMVKAYIRNGAKYLATHDNKTTRRWKDAYQWFVFEIFYSDRVEEWRQINSEHSLLPPKITKNFYKTILV